MTCCGESASIDESDYSPYCESMSLQTGNSAPDFSLSDQDGKVHTLADYQGHWLVIYFYPKDDTPGCTTEACSFRDEFTALKKVAALVGVSVDDAVSHAQFAKKYSLPFPLLADIEKIMVKKYDAWKPKKMFGKEFLGVQRKTVIVDPSGKVAHVWNSVKPEGHATAVLKKVASLQG